MKPGDRAVLTTAMDPVRVVVVIAEPAGGHVLGCATHRDCQVWPEVVVVEPQEMDGARHYWVCEGELSPPLNEVEGRHDRA